MGRTGSAFAFLSLVLLTSSASADGLSELPDVSSSARRMEIPAEQVAGSITIIGREEIERRQLRSLVDVLRTVPGLHVVQSGGPGTQTSVFARGAESNHTLVLLDGIDISDPSSPDGGFDYAHLVTDNVERIEVMRGPQSTLYGSDAIGAVVSIITRRGSGPAKPSAMVEVGAFNTARYAASLRGGRDLANYSLSYTGLHTRGVSAVAEDRGGNERDGYDNRTLSGRIGLMPTEFAEIDLVGRYIDTHGDIDGFGTDDPDARSSTRELFLRSEARLDLLDGRFQPRVGVSYTDYDRKNSNGPAVSSGNSTQHGRRVKFDLQNDFFLSRGNVVTVGAETERETARNRSFSAFSTGRSHESVRTQALFVQEQFDLDGRVFGTAGLRLDHHDEFGSELTYRLASAYVHPSTSTRFHGSIGTGFKAPAIDEMFGATSFFTGNPNLKPERSRSWELGVSQPLLDGRVRMGMTYFQSHVRNLIEPTPTFDSLINVGRARIDGFETFLELRPSERVRMRLDHTYTSAEAKEARTSITNAGQDLLRRPAHQLNALIEVRPVEAATLSLDAAFVGRRKDIDAASFARTSKGSYAVVNVAAAYRLAPRVSVFGRVENLFDREYDSPDGFQSPGVAGYVGVKTEY